MTYCSYLGYPRLNFAGQFRADSDTRNNKRCNYRLDYPPVGQDPQTESYLSGTNEFQFLETKITSVVYEDGQTSLNDPIVGAKIVGNLDGPFAKLIDLDVDIQDKATIYGMKFGISLEDDFPQNGDELAFYGSWTPSVISQDIWQRIICYPQSSFSDELYQDSYPFSSQGTTFITDIEWGRIGDSLAMVELKNAVGLDGQLSVRITIFYYTRKSPHVAFNATLGNVIGTIGVAHPRDTLNFGGQRLLVPTEKIPLVRNIEDDDLKDDPTVCNCKNSQSWMYKAPFEVDMQHKRISVDVSNSLPFSLKNTFCDLKTLQLGILVNKSSDECIYLIGNESIPYMLEGWLMNSGGVYSHSLDDTGLTLLSHGQVVVAQIVISGLGETSVCGELASNKGTHCAHILLKESPYFVRPKGYFVDRLEYMDTSTQTLYVTYYGEPAANVHIKLLQNSGVIPSDGVKPDQWVKVTNSSGLVSFQFSVPSKISYPRQYSKEQCNPSTKFLPIDGQVYSFRYCVDDKGCMDYEELSDLSAISFLAFSTVDFAHPFYWVSEVQPIFAQYAQLSPIMMTILNLSNYMDVTQTRNRFLLNLSMSLPFEDPGYMPTTRDLSPTKQRLILEWLQNPLYSPTSPKLKQSREFSVCQSSRSKSSIISSDINFKPPRCLKKKLSFTESPKDEVYFEQIVNPDNNITLRPLFDLVKKRSMLQMKNMTNSVPLCTKDTLKQQLQTAITLEFATIPLYLTTLYSIIDGCNQHVYQLLHSLVIQEMLHMTQSANILIALGGSPIIDSQDTVPSYPLTGLPGGVLPQLHVKLNKLSLIHIKEVLMGIYAHEPGLYTVNAFYNEILECMKFLNESGMNIFDSTTADKQVKWPWNATKSHGMVYVVTDTDSALQAVTRIISQKSVHLLDSADSELTSDNLGHFYKLEEIVCQRYLKQTDKHHYAYSGAPMPFDPLGVWPMHDDPSPNDIEPYSNCYIESKAFHLTYRAFLRKLQEMFSGHPEELTGAIQLMETLQVHGKKLMWTRFHPNDKFDDRTCGPLWEYEWPLVL